MMVMTAKVDLKKILLIIAAVAALLAFPILYCMKLFHITIELGFVEGILDDSFSIQEIYTFFADKNVDLSGKYELSEKVAETLSPLKAPAIVTLVFLALMLVMVLAVFFCSAFTNSRKVNLCFSILGAASVIGLMASFSNMTGLVIDGTVGLEKIANALLADNGSILGSIASSLGLGGIINVIGELKLFQLTSATMGVLFVFVFIAVWSLSFILIELDEVKAPKAKKQKKQK